MKWQFLTTAFLALYPMQAWAEVCDKVAPNWSRDDGPMTQIGALYGFIANPYVLAFIVCCIVMLFTNQRWMYAIVFVICALFSYILIMDWYAPPDSIYQASVLEGCQTHPTSIVLFLLIFIIAALYRIFKRKPATARRM